MPLTDKGINLRDLSHAPGVTGIAPGRVYRSAAPVFFTEEDREVLAGVVGTSGAVLDLRTEGERMHYATKEVGSDLYQNRPNNHHVDLASPSVKSAAFAKSSYLTILWWGILYLLGYKMLLVAKTVAVVDLHKGGLNTLYGVFLQHGKTPIKRIIERIDATLAEDGVVVYHCTVGKDRTGVVTGLLYLLCGVEKEVIKADFHVSEGELAKNKHVVRSQSTSLHKAVPESVLNDAPHEAMQHVFDVVDSYGGVHTYLTKECGVAPEALERIVKKMKVE